MVKIKYEDLLGEDRGAWTDVLFKQIPRRHKRIEDCYSRFMAGWYQLLVHAFAKDLEPVTALQTWGNELVFYQRILLRVLKDSQATPDQLKAAYDLSFEQDRTTKLYTAVLDGLRPIARHKDKA